MPEGSEISPEPEVDVESEVVDRGADRSVLFVTGLGDDLERYPPLNVIKPVFDNSNWNTGVVQVDNKNADTEPEKDDDDEEKQAQIPENEIEPFNPETETVTREIEGVIEELDGPTYGVAYCLGSFYLTADEEIVESFDRGLLLDAIPGLVTEEGRTKSLADRYPGQFVAVYDSSISGADRLEDVPQIEVEGTKHLHSHLPEEFDDALQEIAQHALEDGSQAGLEEVADRYESLEYVSGERQPTAPGYREAAFEYLMELLDPEAETSQTAARGFYAD